MKPYLFRANNESGTPCPDCDVPFEKDQDIYFDNDNVPHHAMHGVPELVDKFEY